MKIYIDTEGSKELSGEKLSFDYVKDLSKMRNWQLLNMLSEADDPYVTLIKIQIAVQNHSRVFMYKQDRKLKVGIVVASSFIH